MLWRRAGGLCLLLCWAWATPAQAAAFSHDITQLSYTDVDSPLQKHLQSQQQQKQEHKQKPITTTTISSILFTSLERLARLVDIAYCVGSLPGISRPFTCASRCADFPHVSLVNTWDTGPLLTDSCGYVAIDHADEAIVVAFRGTYSIANTVIDLSTVPQEYVPYPEPDDDGDRERCDNCTVHLGFLASWKVARNLVLPAIEEARQKHPGFSINLVGHSLGGAVAALAALELKLISGYDVVVTTFGEPRVGNSGLAKFIDRVFGLDQEAKEDMAYRRVTHAEDPVPLLPLEEWGYRSHAGEIHIEKPALPPAPTDIKLCKGERDPDCSNGNSDAALTTLLLGEEHYLKKQHLKLWQLFFAHRDYFWRLGLCVPGGDPADWGRDKYDVAPGQDEL
ncbi:triacylglycerol lipase FGL2 [Pyricularia oryzae 70-15]|uniref:Triacylglycerol lipase FGL2 n=3 Tax=Pyricularia oryzae TaxID=318829 RepID=G4MS59_PYRO7|nr:triacylglycerol lipase FGL2 [Pyricularia oryzae 70-15]EHA58317.1 triacylglycerol lipase FGL2 [Pyricularia oryzae 70-15]ELQ33005.1 hypothetical protein OOU_Y34scaffold01005g30 [Pyricularia oryzae Y34]KAI7928001.1 triacylglycerol lipase FGL2 [Pyricularia oryzae]KAI7928508.1 triacylglycerol lipase FGL2 [Pyricularia oryzae]